MDLKGKRILILRPLEQAESLAKEIESQGGQAFVFPTLEIHPLKMSAIALEGGAQWLSQCDWAIWLSQQAIYYLPERWRIVLANRDIRMACIGPATGKALDAAGFKKALIFSKGSTSETLSKSDIFSIDNIKNKKIALLSGVGGRTVLFDTLNSRGADAIKLAVYRRVIPKGPILTSMQLDAWGINTIYALSAETLDNLMLLTEERAHEQLKTIQILTLGERLKAHARSIGFDKVSTIKVS